MRLSTAQIKTVLEDFTRSPEGGMEKMLQLCFDVCMKGEREEYLKLEENETDKGNGFRNVTTLGRGKLLELRVPRTRSGNFYPMILGLIKDQEEESRKLAFELYGKGLTTEQVGDVFERFYGKGFSKASVSRMFEYARDEVKYWLKRRLETYYPIVYIDATFWSTRRGEKVSKEAYYTILGVKADRTREVLSVVNFPTESATGWSEVLEELRERGVEEVGLIVADGLNGLEDASARVFPGVPYQKCTVHFMRGMISKVKPADKSDLGEELREVFAKDNVDDSPEKGWQRLQNLVARWEKRYPSFKAYRDEERNFAYFTYLGFHPKIRAMISSTNWIERLNRDYKRTLRMRGVMPDPDSVLLLLGNVAMTRTAYDSKVASLAYENKRFKWVD